MLIPPVTAAELLWVGTLSFTHIAAIIRRMRVRDLTHTAKVRPVLYPTYSIVTHSSHLIRPTKKRTRGICV